MHVRDLIEFLEFIIGWSNPPCNYDPSNLILIGHSCSAHMISTLFFESMEELMPRPHIVHSTKAVILSEGIYDFHSLLHTFPKYREWFIEPAFGPDYHKFSILNSKLDYRAQFPWLLIHSPGDTLVDGLQTTDMHVHLKSSQANVLISLNDVVDEHDVILESEKYVDVVKGFVQPRSSRI
jgi:hypothetical protein